MRLAKNLKELRLGPVMAIAALVGVVGVPVLWVTGYQTSAVVVMLIVAVVLVQAVCIDLPGTPSYGQLEKLWHQSKKKGDKK